VRITPFLFIAASAFLIYAVFYIDGMEMASGFLFMLMMAPLYAVVGDGPAFTFIAQAIWWVMLCGPAIYGVWLLLSDFRMHHKAGEGQ
jgi:uncharacterized membrane protein